MKSNIFLKGLKRLDEDFEKYIAILFSTVMLIMLFLQVLSRYVFRFPLPWSEEIAGICFVLSVYFGAVVAIKRDQHIKIEIVTSMLSEKNKLIFRFIADLIFIGFCIYITQGMLTITRILFRTHNTTAVTGFPKGYIYMCLPLTMFLMSIRLIQDMYKTVKAYKEIQIGRE